MRTNNPILTHSSARLLSAIRENNFEAVSAWLYNPMIDPRELTYEGQPLLHFAIEEECNNSLLCLLSDIRINPNILDAEGNSPLHIAIMDKSDDMVDCLLTCSRVDRNQLSADGITPSMLACLSGYYNCLPLFEGCSTGVEGLTFPPYNSDDGALNYISRLLSNDQFLTFFLAKLIESPAMMHDMLRRNPTLFKATESVRDELVYKLLNPDMGLITQGNYIELLKTIVATPEESGLRRSHPLYKILHNPPSLNAFWARLFWYAEPNADPYIDAIKNKLAELEQPHSRMVTPVAIVYTAGETSIPSVFS